MPDRKLFTACGLLLALWSVAPLAQDRKAALPRMPDGHVDLQGIWDFRSATALERPPDDGRTEQSVHPVWWLDYGKTVVGSRRTSLIVDPPDGKIPALSSEGQRRSAERRAAARTHDLRVRLPRRQLRPS